MASLTRKAQRFLQLESLEKRCVLASLFPAYADGVFTLGNENWSSPYGIENTFKLSSNPSATKTIYLDFDGHHSQNNSWDHDINFPAYNRSGSASSFTDSEKVEIQRIFQNVAEDFLPFDVNVTTEDPGVAALTRSGSGDPYFGVRAVATQATGGFGNGIGGVAYLNSFNDAVDNPVFIFNKGVNNGAMTISHEVGHALGLYHDGLGSQSYHPGAGSGETGWGPIMGAPFGKNVTQWSNGDYANSTELQNDLAVITRSSNGFGFRADDHGSSFGSATPLVSSGGSTFAWGAIEQNTDFDFFEFTTGGEGSITIAATPLTERPNLDIELQVYNYRGNLIASSNPLNQVDASVTFAAAGGTHFVSVTGVGREGRYSDYGSLGFYTLDVSGVVNVIDGDFNDDGVYDLTDIDTLIREINLYAAGRGTPALYDLTSDGAVDLADRDAWLAEAGAANLPGGSPYLAGDANLDGVVDVSDFGIWNANKFTSTLAWSAADFNADAAIDVTDFNTWNDHRFLVSDRAPLPGRNADYVEIIADLEFFDEGPFLPLGHGESDGDHDEHAWESDWRADAVFAGLSPLAVDVSGTSVKSSMSAGSRAATRFDAERLVGDRLAVPTNVAATEALRAARSGHRALTGPDVDRFHGRDDDPFASWGQHDSLPAVAR